MVKAELSDMEGLGFKLEERQRDIMQLKTALKMKVLFHRYTHSHTFSLLLISNISPLPLTPVCAHTLSFSLLLTHFLALSILLTLAVSFVAVDI